MRAERNLFGGGKLLERLGGKSVTQRAQQLVSDIRATQTPNTLPRSCGSAFQSTKFPFWNSAHGLTIAVTHTFPQAYSVSPSTPERLVILRDSTAFLRRPPRS